MMGVWFVRCPLPSISVPRLDLASRKLGMVRPSIHQYQYSYQVRLSAAHLRTTSGDDDQVPTDDRDATMTRAVLAARFDLAKLH